MGPNRPRPPSPPYLYRYQYLKSTQVQDLHFPSLQTANRRLRSLTHQALDKHFTVPNIPERIYHLANKGAAPVAEQLNLKPSDLVKSSQSFEPQTNNFQQPSSQM